MSSRVSTRSTITQSILSSNLSFASSSASGLTSLRSILVQRASGGISLPFFASFNGATPSRIGLGSSGNFAVGLRRIPLGGGGESLSGFGGDTMRTRFSRSFSSAADKEAGSSTMGSPKTLLLRSEYLSGFDSGLRSPFRSARGISREVVSEGRSRGTCSSLSRSRLRCSFSRSESLSLSRTDPVERSSSC